MIEEIKRLKSKLQLETTSTEEMVECLNKLGQKIPPRHVMLDTKIGEITGILILNSLDSEYRTNVPYIFTHRKFTCEIRYDGACKLYRYNN